MRGAKSDFEIFADTEETSKSSKRSERSRKDATRTSKSPPTETRPAAKGTATRPKKAGPENVPKPVLKVLGNNNKENIDPRLGKPAGKKKSGNSAGQDTPKSPPNKVLTALNNANRNVLQGKSQQPVRINDKPAQCSTPNSKQQTTETSALPFSPLADITEAYNDKCPTPLPLSVSFSGTSTVIVDRRSEQASTVSIAQLSETAVRILGTEPRALSSGESKTVELVQLNVLHEDIFPDAVLKAEKDHHNQRNIGPKELAASQPEDHVDDNRGICDVTEHAQERAGAKDASEEITVFEAKVDRSSSTSTMEPIRSDSGNSSVDANLQPPEIRNEPVELDQTMPVENDRDEEEKIPESKERFNEIKTSANSLKRKAPDEKVVNDERPNKRLHDENYTACTDLLVIKLGSDRSETTTVADVPAKKPFSKRFIMECAPGF